MNTAGDQLQGTLSEAVAAERRLTEEEIEHCIDTANRKFNASRGGARGQQITTYDDWKHWLAKEVETAVYARLAAAQAAHGTLSERLKMEAQIHAQEARTANATIAEIYQVVTGKTGEPGNWNGAEPVRSFVAALPTASSVYEAIKHGDERHRAWLKEALSAHFEGRAVPICDQDLAALTRKPAK